MRSLFLKAGSRVAFPAPDPFQRSTGTRLESLKRQYGGHLSWRFDRSMVARCLYSYTNVFTAEVKPSGNSPARSRQM